MEVNPFLPRLLPREREVASGMTIGRWFVRSELPPECRIGFNRTFIVQCTVCGNLSSLPISHIRRHGNEPRMWNCTACFRSGSAENLDRIAATRPLKPPTRRVGS